MGQGEYSHQIRATLEQSNFSATDELLNLADTSESFQEVVTRPSTLYMVSVLWATHAAALRANVTSAKVLQLFIHSTYMRQAEKHRHQLLGERFRFMILTVAERAYFMLGIAAYMAAQRLKNQITRDDLEFVVEQLYEKMPDHELVAEAKPALDEPAVPLKTRISEHPSPLDAIKTDVRTYGLLVRDLSRQDAYRFPHKSYLEVLFAEYARGLVAQADKWPASNIKAATGAQLSALADMPESVTFLAELLSGASPSSIEDELFEGLVIRPCLGFYGVVSSKLIKILCANKFVRFRFRGRRRSLKFVRAMVYFEGLMHLWALVPLFYLLGRRPGERYSELGGVVGLAGEALESTLGGFSSIVVGGSAIAFGAFSIIFVVFFLNFHLLIARNLVGSEVYETWEALCMNLRSQIIE